MTTPQNTADNDSDPGIVEIPLPRDIARWLLRQCDAQIRTLTDDLPPDRLSEQFSDSIAAAVASIRDPAAETGQPQLLALCMLTSGTLSELLQDHEPDPFVRLHRDPPTDDPDPPLVRFHLPRGLASLLRRVADSRVAALAKGMHPDQFREEIDVLPLPTPGSETADDWVRHINERTYGDIPSWFLVAAILRRVLERADAQCP